MTNEEWYKIVKVLNAMYEENGRLMFETPEKIQTWFSCLSDLDYRVCAEAVKRYTLTNSFRPKVADIRKQYALIISGGNMISETEAWGIVRSAISDSLYHAEDRFEAFPEYVKQMVGSPDRLREWAQMPSDTVSSVVRAEFRRAYEVTTQRVAEERQIGSAQLQLSQRIAAQLKIGGGVNVPVVMGDEG